MSSFLRTIEGFSPLAKDLRHEFDQRFANPRETRSDRFVWDYWHVPEQYSLLRTPAYHYFTEKLYSEFHKSLVMWGRKNLGCWDISPPWMSCYIDGCFQNFHSDVPHGAWAFVFSLTKNSNKFSGGETLIFKPEVLNYWQNFSDAKDREQNSFLTKVAPKFNRLTIFDPRLPHGVSELKGTKDPRDGRLVIHGWWTQPKTYLDGYLPEKIVQKKLNQAIEEVAELVQRKEHHEEIYGTQGTIAIGLDILPSGKVKSAKAMTDNLIDMNGMTPKKLSRDILKIYQSLIFPQARGKTWVTVPVILGA